MVLLVCEQELAVHDPLSGAEDAGHAGWKTEERQLQPQSEQSLEAKMGAVRLALARNLARAHIASPMAA